MTQRSVSTFAVLVLMALPADAQPSSDSALLRILSAIPDSQARRFWRDAARSSDLARMAAQMMSFERPVTPRRIARINPRALQFQPPLIPDSALADIVPFSTNPIAAFRGRFLVTSVARGRVTGRLDNHPTPFELYYKLPASRTLPNVRPGSPLELRLLDDSYGMSRRRRILLKSEAGALLLWYFSDGSNTPYRLRLTDPPILIAQQQREPRSVSTVDFSLGGQSTVSLRPGQSATVTWQGRRYEVVVLESVTGPRSRESEGDAYHVTVLLYALS
jgi:hypothetical protein